MTAAMSRTASPSSSTACQELPCRRPSPGPTGTAPRRRVRGRLASAGCRRPGNRTLHFCRAMFCLADRRIHPRRCCAPCAASRTAELRTPVRGQGESAVTATLPAPDRPLAGVGSVSVDDPARGSTGSRTPSPAAGRCRSAPLRGRRSRRSPRRPPAASASALLKSLAEGEAGSRRRPSRRAGPQDVEIRQLPRSGLGARFPAPPRRTSERARARTVWPWASSSATTAEPIGPVPPVMKTCMVLLE